MILADSLFFHIFALRTSKIADMKNTSSFIHLTIPANPDVYNSDPVANYFSDRLLVAQNIRAVDYSPIPLGQPILVQEYRLIRVLAGEMHLNINLRPYCLTTGMVLVSTPQSIIEIVHRSDDFDMLIVAYRNLSPAEAYSQNTLLKASDAMLGRIDSYISLLGVIAQNPNWHDDTAHHIMLALFSDLHSDLSTTIIPTTQPKGRKEQLYERFLELLSEHGDTERRIAFYAERLSLSPNRLSAIIKDYTGQTVMEWINRRTVQRAKVLLRYTQEPIYAIGWQLGFENPAFFAKFFRRETSTSPKEYRENKTS